MFPGKNVASIARDNTTGNMWVIVFGDSQVYKLSPTGAQLAVYTFTGMPRAGTASFPSHLSPLHALNMMPPAHPTQRRIVCTDDGL